ncbi:hypothetical protein SAMN05660368_04248 [Marvinbryantia formatexigens]|nr:hypothetical protein SAMN05660368_04248 [Marvinbryantia formatexigens]
MTYAYKIVSMMLFHLRDLVTKSDYFKEYRMNQNATDRWIPHDHSVMQVTDWFVNAYKEMYWQQGRETKTRNPLPFIPFETDPEQMDFGKGVYREIRKQLFGSFYGAWKEDINWGYEVFLGSVKRVLEISEGLKEIQVRYGYLGIEEDLELLLQCRNMLEEDIKDLLELTEVDEWCLPKPRPAEVTPRDILQRFY